jgi:hypothetical protein
VAATSRSDLRALALGKLADAKLPSWRDRDSSAYCLAGYAVEFALKAVIARRIERHVLPDPGLLCDVHQHEFDRLVGVANQSYGLTWMPRDEHPTHPRSA